jgi:hypothetical protein
MIVAMKRLIKLIFKLMDYDIVRVEKSPRISLLGLRNIPIRTVIDVGANEGQFARREYNESHCGTIRSQNAPRSARDILSLIMNIVY